MLSHCIAKLNFCNGREKASTVKSRPFQEHSLKLSVISEKLQNTFKDLRDQIFNAEAIQTSNVVFRMHYVFTVTGLITASVLLSIGQVTFVNS